MGHMCMLGRAGHTGESWTWTSALGWDHLGYVHAGYFNIIIYSPGSHEHNVATSRRVQFDQSFGGPKVLRKIVTTKCTMGIPDKVSASD